MGIFTAKSLKIFKIGTFACQLTMKWLRQIFSTTMTFTLQTHIGIIRVTRYRSTMTLTLRRSCIRQKLIAILTPDTIRYLSDHYELFIPIYCYFFIANLQIEFICNYVNRFTSVIRAYKNAENGGSCSKRLESLHKFIFSVEKDALRFRCENESYYVGL